MSDTYRLQIAARLRKLRKSRGWSMLELRERLRVDGYPICTSTLYAYHSGGVPLPLDLIPAIAKVYEFKRPGGWLP